MDTNTLALILVIALTLLFIGLGVVLIIIYQRNKKKAAASLSWPETQGIISRSKVVEKESSFGSDDDDGGSQTVYSADVSYSYQVDDTLFTSDRISFAGKSSYSKPAKAEEVVAKYPEGSRLPVYYNPENHEEAVLERSAKGSGIFLTMGIVFLAVAVITVVVGLILLL